MKMDFLILSAFPILFLWTVFVIHFEITHRQPRTHRKGRKHIEE